jgi:hypothetical protein
MTATRASALPISIAVLFVLALLLRGYRLDQPVVTFHATRHYRSALLARACYYDHAKQIPQWATAVADANRDLQPAGELPLMEWLACGAYLVSGRENVMIPRALASLAWVSGALPLLWLALRVSSVHASAIAVALYLFLPYGVIASRNFQPDPIMTLASLWALVALVRHHDHPSSRRLLLAAAAVAAAAVIKPMSVFLTIPAMCGLSMSRYRSGAGNLASDARLLVLAVLPAAAYYGYGAVFGTLAQDQMRRRFIPELLVSSFFWNGLATQVSRVLTIPLLVAAAIGAAVAHRSPGRWLLWSLFAGYGAFAAAFTYHMPTHDYYHLPYIAVVALGIATLVARIEVEAVNRVSRNVVTGVTMAICTAIVVGGSLRALPRMDVANAPELAATYEEIGELTAHDTRVLFLDLAYGYPLMYHGQLSGDYWPNSDDLAAEEMAGVTALTAEARFMRDYADFGPRYFVVTDLASLDAAPDLQEMLAARTTLVRKTDRYHVYRFGP